MADEKLTFIPQIVDHALTLQLRSDLMDTILKYAASRNLSGLLHGIIVTEIVLAFSIILGDIALEQPSSDQFMKLLTSGVQSYIDEAKASMNSEVKH